MSFAYTMEFNSVIKKLEYTETMKFAGKWMRLESLVSSEVTQAQEDKHCMCSHVKIQASNLCMCVYVEMSVTRRH